MGRARRVPDAVFREKTGSVIFKNLIIFSFLPAKRSSAKGDTRLEYSGKLSADSLRPVYPEPEKVPRTAWWVVVRDDDVALRTGPSPAVLVLGDTIRDGSVQGGHVYLGLRGSVPCYAALADDQTVLPEDRQFVRVRDLYTRIPDEELAIAAYAVRMIAYDRNTRFCGRCGAGTHPLPAERAKQCPACGLVTYPRLSPAIIVLIRRGDRILLARSSRFPAGLFGLIAGFVEPGENLEHALRREVMEETGITVENIRYFGSEPWPFPDSLMIGFIADYAGGELAVDPREIESASWFDKNNLPRIPEKLSISRALIDWWLEESAAGSSGSGRDQDRR